MPTLEELLLELGLGDLNLDRLVHLLVVSSLVVGIVLDGGGEQRVDEGRLSETRLAGNLLQSASSSRDRDDGSYHYGKGSAALCNNLVPVLRQSQRLRVVSRCIPLVGQLRHMLALMQGCSRNGCTYVGNANWGQVLGHGGVLRAT
jgi:hypothetical protein